MAKIENREALRDWLEDKPRAVSVAIAARVALRAVPALHVGPVASANYHANIVSPVFRATAVANFAGNWPRQATGIAAAAAAATVAADAAAHAASAGVHVPAAADATDAAAYAADAAVSLSDATAAATDVAGAAAYLPDSAVANWEAVSRDTSFLVSLWEAEEDWDTAAAALSREPLWLMPVPDEVRGAWQSLKDHLLNDTPEERWHVWTTWYEARLDPKRPPNLELELARINETWEAYWEEGPIRVNQKIEEIEARFIAERFPKRPLLDLSTRTGEIIFDQTPPDDPDTFRRVCRELLESIRRLDPRRTNFYSEIKDPCDMLREALEAEDPHPVTVFRRVAQASLSIGAAIRRDAELEKDDKAQWLVQDLRQAVTEIPRASAIVADWIVKRGGVEVFGLPAADIDLIRDAARQIIEAAGTDVAAEIEYGVGVLEQKEPGAPIESEVDGATIYTLGWMLFDVSRLERAVARVIQGADSMSKLHAAIEAAKALWSVILRMIV